MLNGDVLEVSATSRGVMLIQLDVGWSSPSRGSMMRPDASVVRNVGSGPLPCVVELSTTGRCHFDSPQEPDLARIQDRILIVLSE